MDRFLRHRTGLLVCFVACWTIGCELPGIPEFLDGRPDVTPEADASSAPVVCQPDERRCLGNAVRICDAQGSDFTVSACETGETCASGACHPIQNTCSSEQPFALSATELTFDVSSDFKKQTKQVRLTNCGTSTLVLRSASVRSPERPDGISVFALANDLGQVSMGPGDAIDLTVEYRPVQGLSHVAGRLELSLVADGFTNVEIGLRSKAICVASTPRVDFGIVDRGMTRSRTGVLQNCGTEPVMVTGLTGPPHVEVELQEKMPYELRPSEEILFDTDLDTGQTGSVDGAIEFAFDDPMLDASTEVLGWVADDECADLEAEEPQVLVNNQPLVPRPNSLMRVRFPDAPTNLLHWVRLFDQPQASHAAFERVDDGWILRPRIVGRYRATIIPIDLSTGERSCAGESFEFDVLPAAPLHIELSWTTAGDSIPGDLDFGQGANLDLHVLNTTSGVGDWNDSAWDCFPGAQTPCGSAQGNVSLSHSGGIPEIATFTSPYQRVFEVGVYMSNPFDFPGTRARVRVFAEGELVTTLGTQSLQTANDFWLVGRWSEDDGRWTPIDRAFSGFPK